MLRRHAAEEQSCRGPERFPERPIRATRRILIDACLARVRKDAGLDDESVLPPLDVLIGKPERTSSPRIVVGPAARHFPSAKAIVESAVSAAPPARTNVETAKALKPASPVVHRLRWPVVLCGFIGFLFGGMALMRSPVGQRPAVQQVMTTAAGYVETAYGATVAVKSRLVHR